MIKENDIVQREKARAAANEYFEKKKRKPSAAVFGFIEKNGIIGKSAKEMDAIISQAIKLKDGELLGEGDKFQRWCESKGRETPSDIVVEEMNRNPFEAGQIIKKDIVNNPRIWKNWCTYRAGGGRHRV